MTTTEHLCELGCGRPAPDTTICMDCADHPRQAVNQFGVLDISRLYTIALGYEHTKDVAARNSHQAPGPRPPINITAFVLAHDIAQTYPDDIETLPTLPHKQAIDLYWKIIGDCEKAQAMLHGNQVHYTRDQYDDAYKELSEPMTYDDLIEWFWEKLGVRLNHNLLYQWKFKQKIIPVDGPEIHPPRFRPRNVLEIMR